MGGRFYLDLLERTVWTFVQGFCAEWILSGDFDARSLKYGAIAGALSVAKSLVSNRLPWTANDSASSLPAEVDPPQ
jgi:hypothetical protein